MVEGLLRLGVRPAPPEALVNLATGRLHTVREFAERAAAVLGFDASLLGFGDIPARSDEMFHGPVQISRLESCLSWHPTTSIDRGIRLTWEHELAQSFPEESCRQS